MNLILIHNHEITAGRVRLTDRRAHHLAKVLHAKIGDTLRVGLLGGLLGQGLVREISREEAVLEVSFSSPPPPPSRLGLILALPRPIMLNRVLSQVASMGLKRIFLVNANRVEKSFFSASALAAVALAERLRLGLEQGVDTILPEITVHPRFRPFVEDLLPGLAADFPTRLLAHPDATASRPQQFSPAPAGGVLLAIGPEGGWVDFEVNQFHAQGFANFSMGPRILRVDTAVPALISRVEQLLSTPG
ncbi:MAG: 16S rRNA (uracil(1498)-N(3))-methyltransferase [Desulfobulbaceae bacterium]|nr:16S rRNA (uracil(1498)-N(3))-methyltransferase [Desulfobulbaceae bacterium]